MNPVDKLIAELDNCQTQFAFYADQHAQKGTEDGNRKAEVNRGFVRGIERTLEEYRSYCGAEDLAKLQEVPDYRFGTLMKGEQYAFARGLTVNPTHLPAALDAMAKDGWDLMAVFGETNSPNVGFVFRNQKSLRETNLELQVRQLHELNTKLIFENRELKAEAAKREDDGK